jgi:hypothetical protein
MLHLGWDTLYIKRIVCVPKQLKEGEMAHIGDVNISQERTRTTRLATKEVTGKREVYTRNI